MNIKTERLILRDFVPDDWKRVLEYQTDPLYLRYYEWTESDRTPESVQEFVGWFLDNEKETPRIRFQLAITLKSSNLLIGNCGFRMDKANALEGDIGYATEAAHAMVDFGFSRFGVHRVWSWCVADNLGSAHVLEKLGMKLEGRLREKEYYKGKWWDTLMYSILADEWEAHKQSHPVQWKEVKE
jgi:RimJ/RimL family protein N-acetyltransferase